MIRFSLDHETNVVESYPDALRLNYVRVGIWWTHDVRSPPPKNPAPGLLTVGYLQASGKLYPSPQRILYLDSRVRGEGTTANPDTSVTIADPQSISPKVAKFSRPTKRITNVRPEYFTRFENLLEHHAQAINWAKEYGFVLEPYAVETWPRLFMGLNLTGHLQ
jgi:hypothetical protein